MCCLSWSCSLEAILKNNKKINWTAFSLTAQFLLARVCCEPCWSCWTVLGESTGGLLVIPKWICCCLLCNVSPDPQTPFQNFAVNSHYVSLCSLYCQHGMHRSCTNPSQKRQCLLPAPPAQLPLAGAMAHSSKGWLIFAVLIFSSSQDTSISIFPVTLCGWTHL